MSELRDVEAICKSMHDAYERAARRHGWSSQSPVPWADVPEANKATMRDAVQEAIVPALAAEKARADTHMTSSDEAITPLSNRPLSARARRAVTAMKAATAAAKQRTAVLIDPSDPATIERAARALHAKDCGCADYDHGATVERGDYRDLAAAVLASLTDTGDNKEQTE